MAQSSKINILQATDAFAITPSNSLNISADPANTKEYPFCLVHVAGTSGTVAVITADGSTVTVYGIQGYTIPLAVKRVLVTGTSATNLIAFVGGEQVH